MRTKLLCGIITILSLGCGDGPEDNAPLGQTKPPRNQVRGSLGTNPDTNATNADTNTNTNTNPQNVTIHKWQFLGKPKTGDTGKMYVSGDGQHIYVMSDDGKLYHNGYSTTWGNNWTEVVLKAPIQTGGLANVEEAKFSAHDQIIDSLPSKSGLVVLSAKKAYPAQIRKIFIVVGNKAQWAISVDKHSKNENPLKSLMPYKLYYIDEAKLQKDSSDKEVIFFKMVKANSPGVTPRAVKNLEDAGESTYAYQFVNSGWNAPLHIAANANAFPNAASVLPAFTHENLASYVASKEEMLSTRAPLAFGVGDTIAKAVSKVDTTTNKPVVFIHVPKKGVFIRTSEPGLPRQ